jgi:hypothetical protein
VLGGLALLGALWLLLAAATMLWSWTGNYGARGELTVDRCETAERMLSQQLRCRGQLVVESDDPEAAATPATALGGTAAFGRSAPEPGTVIAVYYRAGDPSLVYPERGRSVELARVILGVMPLAILVAGLSAWLLGWWLTRRPSPAEAPGRPGRSPLSARVALRSHGLLWVVVGALWLAADQLLITGLLGPIELG